MKLNKWLLAGMMAGVLLAAGCSDDDDKNAGNSGNTPGTNTPGTQDEITVVDTANWIGAACDCESSSADECEMFGVPLPKPEGNGKIVGCDNVDISAINGGEKVCLRTIAGTATSVAPETYFPKGYCAISAIGCEGKKSICDMVRYGDANALTRCPAGSTLLESTFSFNIMGTSTVVITNKTCARNCKTDADCNVDGEMTCIQHDKSKFCYNQKNLDMKDKDGQPIQTTATPFQAWC